MIKFIILSLLVSFFSGCASLPVATPGLASYNLNGGTYYPLIGLCSLYNIQWNFDTFSRTATLKKDGHNIVLMSGDDLVLVDGRAILLERPVDLYDGTIMVPSRFKEEVIEPLFKITRPPKQNFAGLSRIRKVVVDAGHGGNDPGAIGRTGVREKDINLDIAKRLGGLLKAQGVNVVFTRSSDRFVTLGNRVRVTNSADADIFISVHSNANRVRSLNGFEIYYIKTEIDDSKRALSAAKAAAPPLGNSNLASGSLTVKAILWDLVYTSDRAESYQLARSICRSMERATDARIIGVKGANFEVLRGARMPAVLVESGFLSNPQEERMLKNGFYRQKVAEAIAEGLGDYAADAPFMEARR